MFEYPVCNQSDIELFERQCRALEKRVPHLRKKDRLVDVDGSVTQVYSIDGQMVSVHNSEYNDAIYIKSDIPLEAYFRDDSANAMAV